MSSGNAGNLGAEKKSALDEPHYFVLQLMGLEGIGGPTSDRLPSLVQEVKQTFGSKPTGSKRYVGCTPGLLRSLNRPVVVLKSRVVQGFELADQTSMPVLFHMDDIHFWYDRTDLHKDPDSVEWSTFPKEGETHGPIIPRYWLNGVSGMFSRAPTLSGK